MKRRQLHWILGLILSGMTPLAAPEVHAQALLPRATRLDLTRFFVPSGWMGDGELGLKHLSVIPGFAENPYSPPTCQQWSYKPGPFGWAAVAWQAPANNWGQSWGRDLTGYVRLKFRARGHRGGEVITFLSGGHTDPRFEHQYTYVVALEPITLTKEWKTYFINLSGQNLKNTACAFAWSAREHDNPEGVVFYLDDLILETKDAP